MKRKLFSVVEYHSFYAVRHNPTGAERPMGDGVDTLFTKTGKAMRPGSEHFRRTWERALNADACEIMAAYFSELNAD